MHYQRDRIEYSNNLGNAAVEEYIYVHSWKNRVGDAPMDMISKSVWIWMRQDIDVDQNWIGGYKAPQA